VQTPVLFVLKPRLEGRMLVMQENLLPAKPTQNLLFCNSFQNFARFERQKPCTFFLK
jgi:hypothetical protein